MSRQTTFPLKKYLNLRCRCSHYGNGCPYGNPLENPGYFCPLEVPSGKALPLLNYAYQTLINFEPQLELYAQNFISYWTNEITNQGGIVPFAEHLFPLNNLPDNPFGYKLYISFFLPFELGFHADLSAENKVLSSPYEIVLGILYGEYVKPQNPYAPDYIEDSEAYINALKLLSDKRRFEIMSYLSKNLLMPVNLSNIQV